MARIKDEKRRTQTLRTIKGARESRRRKAEHTRGFKLLPTVSKQLDSGQIDHALKTAQSIKDITARATAYAKIAHVHARAGRLADAFSVVERIEPKKQYLAEQQIASLWAHEKTISGNLRFAESLSNQKWRDVALGYVALSQAVAGRRAQASRTIDKITDDSYWRSNAVQQIIEHHTHKGNETEMAFWLTRVRGGLAKFKAYMRISLVREKAGNRKAAIDWALKARDELQRTAEAVPLMARCWLIDKSIGHGDADSDLKSLSALCQKLGYDQTAFDNMIERTTKSYQEDGGRSLLKAAFPDWSE